MNVTQDFDVNTARTKTTPRKEDKSIRKNCNQVIRVLQTKNNIVVETVEKFAYIHITKIHPDVRTEELKDLVTETLPEL